MSDLRSREARELLRRDAYRACKYYGVTPPVLSPSNILALLDALRDAERERDEALAEVERLQGELDEVHAICDDEPVPSLDADNARMSAAERVQMLRDWRIDPEDVEPSWDANANGTIDSADELAAYAEQAGHEGDE